MDGPLCVYVGGGMRMDGCCLCMWMCVGMGKGVVGYGCRYGQSGSCMDGCRYVYLCVSLLHQGLSLEFTLIFNLSCIYLSISQMLDMTKMNLVDNMI